MAGDATMPPGRRFRPITNGLHQDHRGIRRVGETARVDSPLPVSPEPIATKPNPSYARASAWLALLVVLMGAALGLARDAQAAAEVETVVCWKRLLSDWYDGRIDNPYPVRCYQEAIANLPDDVKVYADAEADIRRALLQAIRQSAKSTGAQPTPETPVKPPSTPKPPPPPTKAPGRTETGSGGAVPGGGGPTDPGAGDPTAVEDTLATGATRSADSLPLPLLVLGALALLLLAAAAAGVVSKRLQARRLQAAGPPAEEPPAIS